MLQQIFCTGCGADGWLPLSVSFAQVYATCEQCKHRSESTSGFHFCTVACFFKWAQGRTGLPCRGCSGSGNAHGFAENGPCRPCGGTGTITENEFTYRRDT